MKNKIISPHFSLLLVVILTITSSGVYSQDELAQATNEHEGSFLKMPKACLRQPIMDTVIPTICNCGKGLVHYQIQSPMQDVSDSGGDLRNCSNNRVVQDGFYSEEELKCLKISNARLKNYIIMTGRNN
jgi:hypothetical protein